MTAAVAALGGKAFRSYRRRLGLEPRTSGEPAALLLSGGGNLGFFHLGVIQVLLENGLLPKVLSGASAGSTMAALIATRSERELRLAARSEAGLSGLGGEPMAGPVTSETVREALERSLPDVTFAEAEDISGRALNISVAARDGSGGLICGPRSTPNVLVRDAVLASCAVPRVFEPVALRERKFGRVRAFADGRRWVDGCIFADVPSHEIKRRYGVRHTIVSMVNPFARPFIHDGGTAAPGTARRLLARAARRSMLGWMSLGRTCASAMPRVHEMFDTAYRLVHQDYSGDLMLTPSRRFAPLSTLLDLPTGETIRTLTDDGAARTRARLAELQALAA